MADGHLVTRDTIFGRCTSPYEPWAQTQLFRALCGTYRGGSGELVSEQSVRPLGGGGESP